ncbi:Spindle pole body component alp14 [Fusarium oxysporum f. sp. albedinis]|nr:Spindle pole body component alp14 [Fusarium oxysporum f. sp. albedinis]
MLKRWWVLVIQDKWRISRKRAGHKKGIAGAQRKEKDQWVRIHGASIGRSASKHWPRNRSACGKSKTNKGAAPMQPLISSDQLGYSACT